MTDSIEDIEVNKRSSNKSAFEEVFGTVDDPGAYAIFKSNYMHMIVYTGDVLTARNPATPCRADFCCDVDNILSDIIISPEVLERFMNHYVLGNKELTDDQERYFEQSIGHELKERKLVPVVNYFRVIRRKKGK